MWLQNGHWWTGLRVRGESGTADVIEELKEKLPAYLARASAIASSSQNTQDTIEWWRNNNVELPKWSKAAECMFLVQPSSSAAERVFSILNQFSDIQTNSLEDYVERTVMLRFNNKN